MKKTIFLIIIIIAFILIDIATGFMAFLDYIAERKTITIESQGEMIVQKIKEHFDIDYNITKVTFQSGIPDGYFLEIYNEKNQVQGVFENDHTESEIYDYFNDVKADVPQHLMYLIVLFIVQFIIVKFLIRGMKNDKKI